MENTFVSDSIIYIGVDDKDIDLFESQYEVPLGVSYNSYLIKDEKIAVMDSVDCRKQDEWFKNLETALDGKKPDYIIVSHMEPDHASSLQAFAEKYPEAVLVINDKTKNMIPQFFDMDISARSLVVKEKDTLSLGKHELEFYMAPMVHWPEVMMTYEKTDKVLFSADGFGKFGAIDSFDEEGWACEARRYYFNIVGKYGAQVQAVLKKVGGLDIKVIAPLHGPVLNDDLGYYIGLYDTWSKYEPETDGIFVAYGSIHGNTKAAAEKMAEILKEKGYNKVSIADLSRDDLHECVEDAFRYSRMIIAAATYDAGLFPIVETFVNHLKSKNYQNRKVGFIENGSWAPMAAKKLKEAFEGMKNVTVAETVVSIKSVMKDKDVEMMDKLAEEMK